MGSGQRCRECGAVIPEGGPPGLCSRCLLKLGLQHEDTPPGTADCGVHEDALPEDSPVARTVESATVGPRSRGSASTEIAPGIEQPGDKIGRYKLLEKIGEGGFGVVYVAEQKEPIKRRVALKIIKLGMDTRQVVARFEAERQALALMDHPNIAKVHDAGATETGRPYFVMELVKGIKITDYCDQKSLPTRERLQLFMQVCQAIQHAHQKGIIHRDIKPSNVLVTSHDGVPVCKVIDFGIAKATQGELTDKTIYTQFRQFIGTPAYMSPEQAEISGLDVDTRSDVYSLGVLLYELLVGKTPFDAQELLASGLDEMRRTIQEKEPLRPSTRLSSMLGEELTTTAQRRGADAPKLINLLRGDLDWIVMKCLEKDRTRRYETANGLARDVQRHLSNEPVVARPPSKRYRFQKLVRRNKLAFAAAGAVAAALVLGLGVSLWLFVRESKAHDRAVAAERAQNRLREAAQAAQAKEVQQRQHAEASEAKAQRNLYVANLNLAQQAWEQNDVGQVRQLLEDTAPFPGRGFEWYYWQRQTHLELKTFRGHFGVIAGVAFSPDGQRIATGSWDGTAKVWDAGSGRELLTLEEHPIGVSSLAFSRDGRRLVTGSWDGTAELWDATSGADLRTFKGHGASVRSVAFSPDDQRVVTGSYDGKAKVWEVATGACLRTLEGHSEALWSVAFSPDGRRIVTASGDLETGTGDRTSRVWDAASGKELLTLDRLGAIWAVAFSPDNQRVITGGADRTAKVWDLATGTNLLILSGHSAWIAAVAFSPDGQYIVTASWDRTAKLWDATSGKERLTLKGHSAAIWSVAFSPDGQQVATGSADNTAKLWQATTDQGPLFFRIHSPQSFPVAVDHAVTDQGPLTLKGHRAPIFSVAFSPDGQRIVTGSGDETARAWVATNGKELVPLKGHGGQVHAAAFSPDGERIVTGSADETAKVYAAATGEELLSLKGHSGQVDAVAFSPDGQRIVTGSGDKTAKVWNLVSGTNLLTLHGHSKAVRSVAVSPDGRRIVTGSADGTAKVWDAATGTVLLTFTGHSDEIWSVAFSPNGQWIVTGSADLTAKAWEAASGKELLSLTGHSAPVRSVAVSPDGSRVVTASDDHTARVWETANGRELLTLKGHSGRIMSVAFSPEGQRIVTGSEDQTAKVWEAATAEQVAAWQNNEQTATEHLAALQDEQKRRAERERLRRAKDPGAIKQWLVLAPIACVGQNTAAALAALDQEQIPQEARLRVRAGERAKVGGNERVWKLVQLQDGLLDFNELVGRETEWSVGYAVSYVQSEVGQTGLLVKVGSDDEAKLFLNAKEIYRYAGNRSCLLDQDIQTGVELKAGLNVLVFKVVNETADWQGSVRFTDSAGQPLKGIRVTLNPNGEDRP